jgi:hypothetical protein
VVLGEACPGDTSSSVYDAQSVEMTVDHHDWNDARGDSQRKIDLEVLAMSGRNRTLAEYAEPSSRRACGLGESSRHLVLEAFKA